MHGHKMSPVFECVFPCFTASNKDFNNKTFECVTTALKAIVNITGTQVQTTSLKLIS